MVQVTVSGRLLAARQDLLVSILSPVYEVALGVE